MCSPAAEVQLEFAYPDVCPTEPAVTADQPLTPELCRTFVALSRHDLSLTRAAAELGVNKATLSKRIAPLVAGEPPHLPRPWLAKRGKRFELTDEGRLMLPVAREHAERWERFVAFAAADRGPALSVACGQEAAGGTMLLAAKAFRQAHPAAAVKIAVVRGRRRVEGVAGGLYDLALVTQTPADVRATGRRDLVVELLHRDDLVLACGVRSPWAAAFDRPDPVPADELGDWPLVLPEADAAIRKQWDEKVGRQARAPAVAVEVGGWRVMLGYVLAGFGVGLLPASLAREAGSKVRWRPLVPALRPANVVSTVRLPTAANEELVAAFLAALRAVVA